MSQVARYWPDGDYMRLLDEAVRAANSQEDIYKRVTVSAWPIRAYLERNNSSSAIPLLRSNADLATQIENSGARSEALLMLFEAARPFASDIWKPVFWTLVEATKSSLSWRQIRNFRLAIKMVAADHPDLVRESVGRLSDVKGLSAVKLEADNCRPTQPRPFFWIA